MTAAGGAAVAGAAGASGSPGFDRGAWLDRLGRGRAGPAGRLSWAEAYLWLMLSSLGQVRVATASVDGGRPLTELRHLDPREIARVVADPVAPLATRFDGRKGTLVPAHAAKLRAILAAGESAGPATLDPAEALARAERSLLPDAELTLVVATLVPPAWLAGSLLATLGRSSGDAYPALPELWARLAAGAGDHLVPRLDRAQVAELRRVLRADLAAAASAPTSASSHPPRLGLPAWLAGAFGLHEELRALLRGLPDGIYADKRPALAHLAVLGLGDQAAVAAELRRLGLAPRNAREVATWIERTGVVALDVVVDTIRGMRGQPAARAALRPLAELDAPEVAPLMLDLLLRSAVQAEARRWLNDHPGAVVAGLAPLLGDRAGTRRAAALAELTRVARGKGPDFVAALLDRVPAPAAESVRAEVLAALAAAPPVGMADAPAWLAAALAAGTADGPAARRSTPRWLEVGALPPLPLGDRVAGPELVGAIVRGLTTATPDTLPPVAAALREHVDAHALDDFAWRLFEEWTVANWPTRDRWVAHALGLLGGDASALRVGALARPWVGSMRKSTQLRHLLDCLGRMGTRTALTQLADLLQRSRSTAVRRLISERLDQIAAAHGLSPEELADRTVPDLDLDADGRRWLDFGPRRFQVRVGPDLQPVLYDEAGTVRAALPRAARADDPELAAAAAAWRLLRRQLREVVAAQSTRLERAMVDQRRWTVDDFERLLLGHPVMRHLSASLVWAGWDDQGTLRVTFRPTGEGDLADVDDRPVRLDPALRVGLAHPAHLDAADVGAWDAVLTDYQLMQAFPQLARPLHTVELPAVPAPGPRRWWRRRPTVPAPTTDLVAVVPRLAAARVPTVSMVRVLEGRGWDGGLIDDGGMRGWHLRAFRSAGVTALIRYERIWPGDLHRQGERSIEHCHILHGVLTTDQLGAGRRALPVEDVDPVVLSEVLTDLYAATAKER